MINNSHLGSFSHHPEYGRNFYCNDSLPPPSDLIFDKLKAWNAAVAQEGWELHLEDGNIERIALNNGLKNISANGPIIAGMSLGNSYFNTTNLSRLFRFLETLDSDIVLAVMDKPSEHNFRAMGYAENKIRDKVRRKSREMRSDIATALETLSSPSARFHIINWDEIRLRKNYQDALNYLESLYQNNTTFCEQICQTTSDYITPKLKPGTNLQDAYFNAEKYLFEELAYLLASPAILGSDHVTYLYHHAWPIYENLAGGVFDPNYGANLGFIELGVQSICTPDKTP